MTRRFYLPQRTVARAKRTGYRNLSKIPVWVMIVIGAAITTAVIWLVIDSFLPPSSTMVDSNSAPPTNQPPVITPLESPTTLERESGIDSGQRVDSLSAAFAVSGDEPIRFVELVNGKVIRLQVLNGCGVKRMAKLVAPALRAKGFDVRETSNAGNFNYARTLVFDRTGTLENALTVADSLGIDPANVSTQISRNLADIDVTIIVGADYENLRMITTHTKR